MADEALGSARRSVIHLLLRGSVDLFRREKYDCPDSSPAGRVNPQGDRCRRSVVGQVEDDIDVVLAKGEVERLHAPADAGGHCLDRGPPRTAALIKHIFGALGWVGGRYEIFRHAAPLS